jgi:glycerophosphoryl diester phosphodiesterase
MRKERVFAVGHRGAAGVLPENTLKGFRYAIELGVDAVECDVHLTRDGRLVVMHDDTVNRTTNGSGKVAEMTLADIRALEAGDGETVPTLEELLDAVRGEVRLLCELKADGTEAPAADAVLARGMASDVLFVSFSQDRLANVKRRRADLRVGAIFGFASARGLARALRLGVEHVGVMYKAISLGTVERARKAGVEIGVWTPNELAEMKAMMALGVDCITTDRPDILMDYLRRQGRR